MQADSPTRKKSKLMFWLRKWRSPSTPAYTDDSQSARRSFPFVKSPSGTARQTMSPSWTSNLRFSRSAKLSTECKSESGFYLSSQGHAVPLTRANLSALDTSHDLLATNYTFPFSNEHPFADGQLREALDSWHEQSQSSRHSTPHSCLEQHARPSKHSDATAHTPLPADKLVSQGSSGTSEDPDSDDGNSVDAPSSSLPASGVSSSVQRANFDQVPNLTKLQQLVSSMLEENMELKKLADSHVDEVNEPQEFTRITRAFDAVHMEISKLRNEAVMKDVTIERLQQQIHEAQKALGLQDI